MARPPNYEFEKRKKEQDRKALKDAKREERRARKAEQREANNPADPNAEVEAVEPDRFNSSGS